MNITDIAKEVFEIESKEIANLSNLLTEAIETQIIDYEKLKDKYIVQYLKENI